MALDFEIGNSEKPRGHALVYFRDSMDSEKLYATYVVVFPLPREHREIRPALPGLLPWGGVGGGDFVLSHAARA